MLKRALWNAVVIDLEIIAQRRFELGSGAKAGLSNDLANTTIEALDHAIGLWMARWNKPVFYRQRFAKNVEGVLAGRDAIASDGIFFLAGEAVRELAAVVSQ